MDKRVEEISDLSFITVESENPFVMFKQWLNEAKEAAVIMPDCFTLATSTRDGKISARTLLLRRLDEDGIVFMTDNRSPKSSNLAENPLSATVFFWAYLKDGVKYSRQVRMEGSVTVLDRSLSEALYENEPLYYKVRAHCCTQSAPVEWHEHKQNYDALVEEAIGGRSLPMPDSVIVYKLQVELMEFFSGSTGNKIADRVVFVKSPVENEWKHHHIAA